MLLTEIVAMAGETAAPPGQQAYTTPGTYTWIAPAGVTSVSVVVVGGGQGGSRKYACAPCTENRTCRGSSGRGGHLSYKNNISVVPGSSHTVAVGSGGAGRTQTGFCCGIAGGNSYFINTSTVNARGGGGDSAGQPANAGDVSAVGGSGNNCTACSQGAGGGGAAGYVPNGEGRGGGSGGSGPGQNAPTGSGGGGGGDGGNQYTNAGGSGGGGVGILGLGSTGNRGNGGGGGSCGASGQAGPTNNGGNGGAYGGGGGASSLSGTQGGNGGSGAVRIIWPGTTRSFPCTGTGDQ